MTRHSVIGSKELWYQLRHKTICFAGNERLKIYGTLQCRSGKRMNTANRIFFSTEAEAVQAGYRPCAHCLYKKYQYWKMDLFNTDPLQNLLPYDGIVIYHGPVLAPEQSRHYMDRLMDSIPWKNDEAVIFGKRIITRRKVAWYGDEAYNYTYSNTTKQALPWTRELSELKSLVESKSGCRFNSCLLNLYHDGAEGMAWHSDDEAALGKDTTIASLSLGAERKFLFKHKRSQEKVSLQLEAGSLLLMQGSTQTHWLHRLPPTKKISSPRINLTFRTIVSPI